MRGSSTVATVASLAIGLVGCRPPDAPPALLSEALAPDARTASPTSAVSYACESGEAVAVAYPDAVTAQLTYDSEAYVLRSDPAAPGGRYVGSSLEWWAEIDNGHESATLSRLSPANGVGLIVMERCSRPLSGSSLSVSPSLPPPPPPPSESRGSIPAPCRGAQLRLSAEGQAAVATRRVVGIAVQNISGEACTLIGYPGVILQDGGRPLAAVRTEWSTGGYFTPDGAPDPVALRPQARGAFEIAWNQTPPDADGARSCFSATGLQVTAPGDDAPVLLDYPMVACGGRIRITPMRPSPTPRAA